MPHRVTELYCIMPIANVASVMVHGILSHDEAARLSHADISLAEVQKRREQKSVPGGLRLHEYANLYFCARNPMMYRRQGERERLCVLLVDRRLLESPGIVLSTGNAASDYSRFLSSPAGLQEIAWDDVFADYWTDENPLKQMRKKSAKCAEVLVPHCVKPCFITGAYVSCTTGRDALLATGFELPITINPDVFFG
ncbi:MAG TPA: DUF4433 domain-containing protein [Lentisphaeria bacterium]|nr:DUF4433 domain-containing protein [Lentisphaeria bacterium]